MKLELRHVGGGIHEVEVTGKEPGTVPALTISWSGLAGDYVLDLPTNTMVTIKGDRIVKRHLWKARDINEAKRLWCELVKMHCDPMTARGLLMHPCIRALEESPAKAG